MLSKLRLVKQMSLHWMDDSIYVSYICMYYLGVLPVSWQYKESVFDKKQEKGTPRK